MIGIFAAVSVLISVIYAFISGNMSEVSEALLNEPVNAAELAVYLCGGMCFWNGLMRAAESSGIVSFISRILEKPLSALFVGLDTSGRAFRYICMNISANMLGLGNAATPFGVEAMKALSENAPEGEADDNMVIFAVMNTASLTLIPSTAASLRLKYGAESPFDIMPAVLFTSAVSLAAALTAAKLGCVLANGRKRNG